jgi:hypothetical protein
VINLSVKIFSITIYNEFELLYTTSKKLLSVYNAIETTGFTMTNAIHYIGTTYLEDYEHLHLPLTVGELPADEVVLVHSEAEDMLPSNLRQSLVERLEAEDISVRSETIGKYGITQEDTPELFTFAIKELRSNLQSGHEIYINAGSPPVLLGYCFLFAAELIDTESPETLATSGGGSGSARQRTHLYWTRGTPYLPDILNALKEYSGVITQIETNTDRQATVISNLKDQIQDFDSTLHAITQLRTGSEEGAPRWQRLIRTLRTQEADSEGTAESSEKSIESLTRGIQDLFEGLEKIEAGLSTLQGGQSVDEFVPEEVTIDDDAAKEQVDVLLEHLGGDSDNEVKGWLRGELEDIDNSLDELAFRQQDLQRLVDEHEAYTSFHREIEEHGLTYGSASGERDLAGHERQRYYELPSIPDARLNNTEKAVLITLNAIEEAESITELIDELVRVSLRVSLNDSDEITESDHPPGLIALYNDYQSDPSTKSTDREELISALRSKIQYNIDKLEEKNLIRKVKHGRANKLTLTKSGELWNAAMGYDLESLAEEGHGESITDVFEALADDVYKRLT